MKLQNTFSVDLDMDMIIIEELLVHVYYFSINNNMPFFIFSDVFNYDVSLFSSQVIFVSIRAYDSKHCYPTSVVNRGQLIKS